MGKLMVHSQSPPVKAQITVSKANIQRENMAMDSGATWRPYSRQMAHTPQGSARLTAVMAMPPNTQAPPV